MSTNRYLLDTHALIWFQEDDAKMPSKILEIIQNVDNIIFFSQISLFEIAIKQTIGKLPSLKLTVEQIYNQALADGFTFLSIQNAHLYLYRNLKLLERHRDPFDRLIITTAIKEDVTILSNDDKFHLYNETVKVFWA